MKNIVERSQMIINVQELHKEIVVLEAELKLQRLRKSSNEYIIQKKPIKENEKDIFN